MDWNNLKNNSFYSSGLIRVNEKDEFVDALEIDHSCNCAVFSMNDRLYLQKNSFSNHGIFTIYLDNAVRFLENVSDRDWLLDKSKLAFDALQEQKLNSSITNSIVYLCPAGTNLLHPESTMFVYEVKENQADNFYFTDVIKHDNSVNSLYFAFFLENELDIWKKLTSGKFWSSGNLLYRENLQKFIEPKPVTWESNNQKGCAVPGDSKTSLYSGSVWDGIELTGYKPVYIETSFKQFRLKPSITECLGLLEERERNFFLKAYNKAFAFFKQNFLMDFISYTIVLSRPGHSIAMHNHYDEKVKTFTYVFSSKSSSSERATLVVETNPGEYTEKNYPDCEEFFFLLSSEQNHGVRANNDDKYYLYFVLDGANPKEGIEYEYNKFYRIDK